MRRRIEKLEAMNPLRDRLEDVRLEKLGREVAGRLDNTPLSKYRDALKKLTDDEVTALVWHQEQQGGYTLRSLSTAELNEILLHGDEGETASIEDVEAARDSLVKEFPTPKETPTQFRRVRALTR